MNKPYLAGLGIFCGAMVLGVIRRGTTLGNVLIAVAVTAALIMVITAVLQWRLARVVRNAGVRRPGAAVIPAYITGEQIELAVYAGAKVSGWMAQGGNAVAVTVSPDAIELWSGTEPEPRISIAPRNVLDVGVFSAAYGARDVPAVGVRTEQGGLMVVPAYRRVRNMGGPDAPGTERALATLRAVTAQPG